MNTRRISQVFHDDVLTLFAVESVESGHSRATTRCQLYGTIRPVALVVCAPDRAYALDMEARPLDLEQLVVDVPELGAFMARSINPNGQTGE